MLHLLKKKRPRQSPCCTPCCPVNPGHYELSITCRDLARRPLDVLYSPSPLVVVSLEPPRESSTSSEKEEKKKKTKKGLGELASLQEVGRTEIVQRSRDAKFSRKIFVTVEEEDNSESRMAELAVWDAAEKGGVGEGESLGTVRLPVSKLVAHAEFTWHLSRKPGLVTVAAAFYEPLKDATLNVALFSDSPWNSEFWGPCCLEILRSNKERALSEDWTLVYKSEPSNACQFKPFDISMFTLTRNSKTRQLKVLCWSAKEAVKGSRTLIGGSLTTLEKIEAKGGVTLCLRDQDDEEEEPLKIVCEIQYEADDYIA